ncbi:hypothetical protein [Candidatus Frankia alpina]|uniref:hypothetical protein n=1 Tax=Candidatus Frankia alpina TaxID=2699483 RepID=UPI001A97FA79|nr:hypothetical protein [Candidatus Frankia alpina]
MPLDRCDGTVDVVDVSWVVAAPLDSLNQEPSSGSTSIGVGWNGSEPVPGDAVAAGAVAGLVASPPADSDGVAVVVGADVAVVPAAVAAPVLGAMERRSVGPVAGWSRGISEMIGIGAVVGPSATVLRPADLPPLDEPEPLDPVPA